MIDVHAAVVAIHDANLTGGKQAAIRATTDVLADCWDDCAAATLAAERSAAKTFPPDGEPGNWQSMNPYRLALEMTPDGPHAPRVEGRAVFVDEPADGNGVDGVWVVWRTPGDRSQGFNAIYPQHEELEALRQVNTQGFGHVEFIPFGVEIA